MTIRRVQTRSEHVNRRRFLSLAAVSICAGVAPADALVGAQILTREIYVDEAMVHRSLAGLMVRSKSEVIIADMLFDRGIAFEYEKLVYAPDGSYSVPDFTIMWRGEPFFWEHLGLSAEQGYRRLWAMRKSWYERHFPARLITTEGSENLSTNAKGLIEARFS